MVERHARSVVSATDALSHAVARGLEPDAMGAGVARVLQELPHKDPGVGPVPLRLEASALQESATSRIGHHDSVGPPSGEPMQGTRWLPLGMTPGWTLHLGSCIRAGGGRQDTIGEVTTEQISRLRTFIRSTLGCGCPDEVLEWIQCTHTELTQEDDTRITRIDVGGRLLVYVLEIEGPDWLAEEALPAVIAAATVDRATSCFSRLRVVVAIDDPEEMKPRMERIFNGSAPADEKVHLHVVSSTDLPFD